MSSHREAREISKDPVADSTDVYAFMSPDRSGYVTLIANYVPLQEPAGGPNFYEFGDDVLYEIHIDNDGDARPDITYQFRFKTRLTAPGSFLYNTGPITSLGDTNWNSKQFYSVVRIDGSGRHVLGRDLACPPCNIGPLSTPDYEANLGSAAIHTLPDGHTKVFAGQRAEAFYVDLGSIFDLGNLRPLQQYQAFAIADKLGPTATRTNATNNLNVHSIALQVRKDDLVIGGHPTIGVWTSASRRRVRLFGEDSADSVFSGPWHQVSRLGNPLINEVLIPLGEKDFWNTQQPVHDKQFLSHYANPELAQLLPILYPGKFPALASLQGPPVAPRADLEAVLLTGVPAGLIPGFTNLTGSVQADMLRLNTSIPPTAFSSQNVYGVAAGDLAGYPNGRRIGDDVVTIELEAIAGLLYHLVAPPPGFTADPVVAALEVNDGLTGASINPVGQPTSMFPYLGTPYDGYDFPA
jgi:Domain of unknown function (DUF4331)